MGRVYLIGAGPGDPELLTLKAARILAQAEVVLRDGLVSREVLAMVAAGARVIDAGKRCGRQGLGQEEINALLVLYGTQSEVVVRLKGGDPSVFGRAGEELEALRDAGIEVEIVPGVTAAVGAAAAAGISLTDRRLASQVVLSTYSRRAGSGAGEWGALTPETTLVLYMPGREYGEIAQRLREAGLPADFPCVIVSSIGRPEQEIRWSNVGRLGSEARLSPPAILIAGRVAAREWKRRGGAVLQGFDEALELAGVNEKGG